MKRCLLVVCEVFLYLFALLTVYVSADLVSVSPDDSWNLGFMMVHVGKAPYWTHWVTSLFMWGLLVMLWHDVPKYLAAWIKEAFVWGYLLVLIFLESRDEIEDRDR